MPGEDDRYSCPVCGWPYLSEPPRLPAGGGSYEICWSCGFEYGVTDDDEGYFYRDWRDRWIEAGMPWTSAPYRPAPEGWDPQRQLDDLLAGDS